MVLIFATFIGILVQRMRENTSIIFHLLKIAKYVDLTEQ